MPSVRCFVALDVSKSIRTALGEIIGLLRREVDGVRWVRPESVHLTIKFLGDVDRARLGAIKEALRGAVSGSAIPLRLTALGGFPRADRARVIWVGVDGDLAALSCLQNDVEMAVETIGFEREQRAFSPHLTVGRARRSPVVIPDVAVPELSFEGAVVALMESRLRPGGSVYTPIDEFQLPA